MENPLKKLFKKEKKINIEDLKDRGRLILTTMLVSFYFGSGNQVEAQSNMPIASAEVERNPIDFEKKYQAPESEVSPEVLKKIEGMYQEQKAWLLKYMQSESYFKHLAIEWIHNKEINENIIKKMNLENQILLDNIFSPVGLDADFSKILSEQDIVNIQRIIAQRIEIVKNMKYKVKKDLPGFGTDEAVAAYYLISHPDPDLAGTINVDSDLISEEGSSTAFAHELDHASLDGFGATPFGITVTENRTFAEDEYLRKSKEILGRRTAFLFLLAKEGIYDITTAQTPFTLEMYNQAVQNPSIIKNSDSGEFLSNMYTEDVIFLINNMASTEDIIIRFDENGRLQGVNDMYIYDPNWTPNTKSQTATG